MLNWIYWIYYKQTNRAQPGRTAAADTHQAAPVDWNRVPLVSDARLLQQSAAPDNRCL